MKIEPFLFNWNKQNKNVNKIISQLDPVFNNINVINSDENHLQENWINIGNEFYFGGQFNTALKYFSGDVLLHIQGDVSYDKWKELVDDAKLYMQYYNCGIYAPNIYFTNWKTKNVKIKDYNNILKHKDLDLVSCTDSTVWFIHRDIINKMKEYSIKFADGGCGWGVDLILSSISFLNKRLVIRDGNHTITHPKKTNYDSETATYEFKKLKQSLPIDILKLVNLIIKYENNSIYEYLIKK